MLVVGIDVGGTHTKFGLVENGKIIRIMEMATNTFDIVSQVINGSRDIVSSAEREWSEVDGIGIGIPGMVIDSIVQDCPNINLHSCDLQKVLSKELGKTVVVKNDAEMATLSEHKMGAGANCENMVMITVGTGVGGGIIINRELYIGSGGAGELGHIAFKRYGRPCGCGRLGCAEQYVSMIALDRDAKDTMIKYPKSIIGFSREGLVYASELMRAYKKQDLCATEIVDKYVENLTHYVLDLCNMFRPNRIVIGGGITYAPEIIDMVARNCRKLEFGYKNSPKVDIVAAKLGNRAGILGGYISVHEKVTGTKQEYELVEDIASIEVVESSIPTKKDSSLNDQYQHNGELIKKSLADITSQIGAIRKSHFQSNEDVDINK